MLPLAQQARWREILILDELRDALPTFRARDAADPETYPSQSVADLYAMGIIQAPFAPEHGGTGLDVAGTVAAIEMLAGASGSLGLIAAMPIGLGVVYSLPDAFVPADSMADWRSQVERVSADFRAGRIYAACNSEKGAGGSVAATKVTARRGPGGVFRLDGEKILATSGKYAYRFFSTGKVTQEDLPGAGIVEFFFVPTDGEGVEILSDWDGFGMRPTESHSVRYHDAPVEGMLGFPNFLEAVQPLQHYALIFAAIPLGCAGAILRELTNPAPSTPALRLRFNEALMRYEALRAYLLETASILRPAAPPAMRARVMRTKTYVGQEATKLAAELFALSGGRSYRRGGSVARSFSDAFAGTALRPPLALGLDTLSESFLLE